MADDLAARIARPHAAGALRRLGLHFGGGFGAWLKVCGVAQCCWFGAALLLNLRWTVAPNLLPPEPDGVYLAVGVLGVVVGVCGLVAPAWFALVATALVCGERGFQAWLTFNGYAVGVWAIFAACTAVAEYMRFAPDGCDGDVRAG